jgi:hypothetical protein
MELLQMRSTQVGLRKIYGRHLGAQRTGHEGGRCRGTLHVLRGQRPCIHAVSNSAVIGQCLCFIEQ